MPRNEEKNETNETDEIITIDCIEDRPKLVEDVEHKLKKKDLKIEYHEEDRKYTYGKGKAMVFWPNTTEESKKLKKLLTKMKIEFKSDNNCNCGWMCEFQESHIDFAGVKSDGKGSLCEYIDEHYDVWIDDDGEIQYRELNSYIQSKTKTKTEKPKEEQKEKEEKRPKLNGHDGKVYFNIPFEYRGIAQKFGAIFDYDIKKWCFIRNVTKREDVKLLLNLYSTEDETVIKPTKLIKVPKYFITDDDEDEFTKKELDIHKLKYLSKENVLLLFPEHVVKNNVKNNVKDKFYDSISSSIFGKK